MNPVKLELIEHLSMQTEDSTFLVSDSTLEQRNALIELKKEGLIECKYRTDQNGNPSDFFNIKIISSGREVLGEIDNPPKEKMNIKAWTFALSFVVFVFGALRKILELYDLPS